LWLALPVLALAVSACGSKDPLDLHTPGVTPQSGRVTPAPRTEPVTRDEVAVIRGWSDELRRGHVAAASRYFSIPTVVANGTPPVSLRGRAQVRTFNRTLPCGAKLMRWRRAANHFVIATFMLTDRPGGDCGAGTGNPASVAFLIKRHHISEWLRVPDSDENDSGSVS
jgi:hypothetical protein